MNLDQQIRRSPATTHLTVTQNKVFGAVARQAEQKLSQKDAAALADVSVGDWQKLATQLEDDALFKRYVAQVQAGSAPTVTPEDEKYVETYWKKTILAVIGGISAVAGVLGVVFAFIAVCTGLASAVPATVIFGLLAAVCTAIAVLGGALLTFLWLFLPDTVPNDPGMRGGGGGDAFMDAIPHDAVKIAKVDVKHKKGDVVRAIRVHWLLRNGNLCTGNWSSNEPWDGETVTIDLAADEFLTEVNGRAGGYVDQLELVTNKTKYGPYGGSGGSAFSLKPMIGAVMGLRGRAKGWLDAIGVLSDLQRIYHGTFGGVPFCDEVTDVVRIGKVTVRHKGWIDGIQIEWVKKDGSTLVGDFHGGNGGNLDFFTLDEDEHITEISGVIGNYIDRLTFKTSKGKSYSYGQGNGSEHFKTTLAGDEILLGFFGRAQQYLDGIGPLIGRRKGMYRAETRAGGVNGKWTPYHPITVTDSGEVYLGTEREVRLYGTIGSDGCFDFPKNDLNPEYYGNIHFKSSDAGGYYWGNEVVPKPCLTGSIWYRNDGGLDLRGRG